MGQVEDALLLHLSDQAEHVVCEIGGVPRVGDVTVVKNVPSEKSYVETVFLEVLDEGSF